MWSHVVDRFCEPVSKQLPPDSIHLSFREERFCRVGDVAGKFCARTRESTFLAAIAEFEDVDRHVKFCDLRAVTIEELPTC